MPQTMARMKSTRPSEQATGYLGDADATCQLRGSLGLQAWHASCESRGPSHQFPALLCHYSRADFSTHSAHLPGTGCGGAALNAVRPLFVSRLAAWHGTGEQQHPGPPSAAEVLPRLSAVLQRCQLPSAACKQQAALSAETKQLQLALRATSSYFCTCERMLLLSRSTSVIFLLTAPCNRH